MRPLADEIRPQSLEEVAGQKHLLGEGALLRRLIENGTEANFIFYGPSGTGKTTIANIIGEKLEKTIDEIFAARLSNGMLLRDGGTQGKPQQKAVQPAVEEPKKALFHLYI